MRWADQKEDQHFCITLFLYLQTWAKILRKSSQKLCLTVLICRKASIMVSLWGERLKVMYFIYFSRNREHEKIQAFKSYIQRLSTDLLCLVMFSSFHEICHSGQFQSRREYLKAEQSPGAARAHGEGCKLISKNHSGEPKLSCSEERDWV